MLVGNATTHNECHAQVAKDGESLEVMHSTASIYAETRMPLSVFKQRGEELGWR